MTFYTIRPIVVAPDEQYYKLNAVITKEAFSAYDVQ
jgi:hypothetical protein